MYSSIKVEGGSFPLGQECVRVLQFASAFYSLVVFGGFSGRQRNLTILLPHSVLEMIEIQ